MSPRPLADLTLPELLDQLAGIPEPPPVSWWPQTEAWGWVALAVALGLAVLAWRLAARRRASAYRRAALRELARRSDSPAAVAAIVRRTALAAYPRRDVAGLTGDDWLRFLDRTSGSEAFTTGAGRALAAAPYAPRVEVDPEVVAGLARRWIERHDGAGPRVAS